MYGKKSGHDIKPKSVIIIQAFFIPLRKNA